MIQQNDLIREAIEKKNRQLEAAFRSRDIEAVAACYTPDAVLLPTGSEPVRGTGSIADFWIATLQMGIADVRIETQELDGQGATAIEMGQYTLRGAGDQLVDQGKYVVIWKLIKGEWKLHRDIWNTNLSHR